MKQKGLRKLVSVILAVVMVLSMSITGFAADITITGAQAGHTYTAYQIFTGTLYKGVLSDIDWGNDVDGDALISALEEASNGTGALGNEFPSTNENNESITYTAAMIAEIVAGWNDDSEKLIAFAAIVADCLKDDATGTESVYTNDLEYAITDLDDGYYLVSDTSENDLEEGDAYSRYIIKVAGEDVSVETKTEYPTIDKTVNDTDGSVQVGQTVTYTIVGEVPDTTGYDSYTYKVSDTMSAGLTFDFDSLKMTIGSTTITFEDDELTSTDSDNDGKADGFRLVLDMTDYQDYKGETITITYCATINENAVNVISTNNATLEYSNNPNDASSTNTTPTEEVKVYSAKIVIDKFAEDNTTEDNADNIRLSGAIFALYKYDADSGDKLYYKYTEDDEQTTNVDESKVEWVNGIEDATKVTTGTNGAAEFIGLENGTYYLVETEAPAGYNTANDTKVEIVKNENSTNLSVTAEIVDRAGSTLPSTGGIGTTIFYIVGGVLVLGAAVLFVTKKRLGGKN